MRIDLAKWSGAVTVRGGLTDSERVARINAPLITIHIDPADMESEPAGWVEPVYSDAFVDAATNAFREWLLSQR